MSWQQLQHAATRHMAIPAIGRARSALPEVVPQPMEPRDRPVLPGSEALRHVVLKLPLVGTRWPGFLARIVRSETQGPVNGRPTARVRHRREIDVARDRCSHIR